MPKNATLEAQIELIKLAEQVSLAANNFVADPILEQMGWLGELIRGLAWPIRTIEYADNQEQLMEMIRTFELHGDGWLPFAAEGYRFKKGDLLVTSDRSLCIVTEVNDKGKVSAIAGDSQRKSVVDGKFELIWSPLKSARKWLTPGSTAAPAYTDMEAALVYLIRQWGNTQSDNGRDIRTSVGFFCDVLRAPGLKLDMGDIDEYSSASELLAFCAERGLLPIDDRNLPTVGDFALFKKKTWAIVTRVVAPDSFDVLLPSQPKKGTLSETVSALRLVRHIPVDLFSHFWRPAGKNRLRAVASSGKISPNR